MIFVTPRSSCRPTHTYAHIHTHRTHTHTHIHIQRISDEVLVQLDDLVQTPKEKMIRGGSATPVLLRPSIHACTQ